MSVLLNKLHNRFAFLRRRIERKLAHDQKALDVFRACHLCNPDQIKQQPIDDTRFIILDTETTGFHAYSGDEVIDIAMIEMQGLEETGRSYQSYVNPQRSIPVESTDIHHLTDKDVRDAPVLLDILPDILGFIDNAVLVGHHINFDIRFINKTLQKYCHGQIQNPWIDTMLLFLEHRGQIGHYSLEEVARYCQVEITHRHSAEGDARATAAIFAHLVGKLVSKQDSVGRLVRSQYETRSKL
ncbi:MAG: 3'-5' exonuclease [Gammaproteobacteria bacterium]|nr:3'-5' exonuclease [Gammaproteobacteria bacterium]